MLLLLGAFIAGLLTVLAPCVLPLLPIIIGGSVSGDVQDKKRPLVIAAALAMSLVVCTLLLKVTTVLINVPPQAVTYVSGAIIILVGISMLFPMVYAFMLGRLGIESRAQGMLNAGFRNKRRFIGPIIIGASLGPVFSSCSPVYAYILATVLPVNFARAFLYIIAYVLGLSLVLLLIGYYGQRFVGRIRFASNPYGWFQRTVAILFIVVGLLVCTGYDKRLQTYVSQHTPFNFDTLSTALLPKKKHPVISDSALFNITSYQAPELTGGDEWINSKPIAMADLKGKVVLVDFWTYSCINCIRNNPYLETWYNKYKVDGLVIIGVHAPEFAFERVAANVKQAVKDQHITYPVVLDNNFTIWNAFANQSWPASYLIDQNGQVRRLHEGEGEYDQSEAAIRQLLQAGGAHLGAAVNPKPALVPVGAQQTPETYLGRERASGYDGSPALDMAADTTIFTIASSLDQNNWSLGGSWQVESEKIIARGNSTLKFRVAAKDVYLVGGSATPQKVAVLVDGKPAADSGFAGADVHDGAATFGEARLYRLVDFKSFSSEHEIELQVPAGVELNAFTFGS